MGKDSNFGRAAIELAPVFVLLALQGASFINGEVYGVTGGKGVARAIGLMGKNGSG